MEKLILWFFFPLLFSSVLRSQGKEKIITFIVKPLLQPNDSAIYITGNAPKLGGWNPALIPLEKQKDGTWKLSLVFNKGDELEYKFTKGAWSAEAVDSAGKVPGNYKLVVQNDTVVEVIIESWKDNFERKSNLQITGDVQYFRDMQGDGILPRDIIVWLPPGYNKSKIKKYPVLYMQDGQNIIDPLTATFGVDWQIDETADSLIKQKKMKEIIIVGIYNTKNRTAEYSYTDTGFAYMKFIVKKLKPFIDSKFRTLPDRDNTAVMGSSMGGLISLMLAWQYTNVFSKAGCLSPAFKIDDINYLPYIEKYKGKKKNIKLYIDDGGTGLEKKLLPGIKETIELLDKKGYKTGKDIMWFYDENAEHNESAWAARVWKPLLFMFGK